MMVLAMIVVVCLASIRMFSPEDPRPLSDPDRVLASLLDLLDCFGLVLGLCLLLASAEMVKQVAARYRARRGQGPHGDPSRARRPDDPGDGGPAAGAP
jgi:hypothetical protein